MLIGAGLGAGTSMLSGNDPLKGAAIGGAMGGVSAGFGGAGVDSAGKATAQQFGQTASHVNPALTQTGAQQATSNAAMGGLSSQIGGGFNAVQNATGLTNRDMSMMAINQGMNAMQPQQQQQIQHTPMGTGISRPQVDLSQGGSAMNSNPRFRKQGLL